MAKKVITFPDAPKAPYSPAIQAGGFIFVSGQIGPADAEGKKVEGIQAQTKICLEKIKRILAEAGASLDDAVKLTVYIRNAQDFAKMNDTYQEYFTEDKPARAIAVVDLPSPDWLIEIDCIAYKP